MAIAFHRAPKKTQKLLRECVRFARENYRLDTGHEYVVFDNIVSRDAEYRERHKQADFMEPGWTCYVQTDKVHNKAGFYRVGFNGCISYYVPYSEVPK